MKTVITKGNHMKGSLKNGMIRINDGEKFNVIRETKNSIEIKKGDVTKLMSKNCFYEY